LLSKIWGGISELAIWELWWELSSLKFPLVLQ
jgi:hypothetical protein